MATLLVPHAGTSAALEPLAQPFRLQTLLDCCKFTYCCLGTHPAASTPPSLPTVCYLPPMALSASLQPCSAPAALRRGPWVRLRPAAATRLAAAPRRQRQQALPPTAQQQQQEQQQQEQQQQASANGSDSPDMPSSSSRPLLVAAAGVAAAAAFTVVGSPVAGAQLALELHAEPANALSLPTWMVHVSSVVEWIVAMGLM